MGFAGFSFVSSEAPKRSDQIGRVLSREPLTRSYGRPSSGGHPVGLKHFLSSHLFLRLVMMRVTCCALFLQDFSCRNACTMRVQVLLGRSPVPRLHFTSGLSWLVVLTYVLLSRGQSDVRSLTSLNVTISVPFFYTGVEEGPLSVGRVDNESQ